jgi:VanZ family protein
MRSVRLVNAALVLALCAILFVTLRPFDADNDLELLPFADFVDGILHRELGSLREAVMGAVGNVLLFVPLGAILAMRGASLARAATVGLLISAAVELAQLVVPGRTTSVDDLIFNLAGAVGGFTIAAAWMRPAGASGSGSRRTHAQRFENAPHEPANVTRIPLLNRVTYGHEAVGDERHAEGRERRS